MAQDAPDDLGVSLPASQNGVPVGDVLSAATPATVTDFMLQAPEAAGAFSQHGQPVAAVAAVADPHLGSGAADVFASGSNTIDGVSVGDAAGAGGVSVGDAMGISADILQMAAEAEQTADMLGMLIKQRQEQGVALVADTSIPGAANALLSSAVFDSVASHAHHGAPLAPPAGMTEAEADASAASPVAAEQAEAEGQEEVQGQGENDATTTTALPATAEHRAEQAPGPLAGAADDADPAGAAAHAMSHGLSNGAEESQANLGEDAAAGDTAGTDVWPAVGTEVAFGLEAVGQGEAGVGQEEPGSANQEHEEGEEEQEKQKEREEDEVQQKQHQGKEAGGAEENAAQQQQQGDQQAEDEKEAQHQQQHQQQKSKTNKIYNKQIA
eukprot:m.164430 g.164430  ORF g.164430 m.164430 type:complete len:383 (+) comp17715_c0_seq1:256-1404(+)